MFQTQRPPLRPSLHALVQLRHLRVVLPFFPLKQLHLFLDKLLSDASLMKRILIDKDLVGVVVRVITGHLEAFTFACGATLDLGYQLADVLFHLNS